MQFSVTGRHLEITDSMKQYAQEKVSKLERFYDRIGAVDIVLDRESSQFRTEIVLRTDHKHTFVAQVDAGDFYESIDLVLDKMERQLREHKEKFRNRKHPSRTVGLVNRPEDEAGSR